MGFLLDFAKATVSRLSGASYLTSNDTMAWADPNVLRTENRGDGEVAAYLLEDGKIQDMGYPRDFSTWTPAGDPPTISLSSEVAPDGGAAYDFAWGAAGTSNAYSTPLTGVADDTQFMLSVWAKVPSGSADEDFRMYASTRDGLFSTEHTFSATTVWQRFTASVDSSLNGGSFLRARLRTKSGGGGNTHIFSCFDVWENQKFPLSHYSTGSESSAPDSLKFISGSGVASRLLTGSWYMDLYPYFDNNDMSSGDEFYIFGFNATNYLKIQKVSSDTYFTIFTDGGALNSNSITWQRYQRLRVLINFHSKTLAIENANSGNGVVSSSVITTWPLDTTLIVGAAYDDTSRYSGRLSNPVGFDVVAPIALSGTEVDRFDDIQNRWLVFEPISKYETAVQYRLFSVPIGQRYYPNLIIDSGSVSIATGAIQIEKEVHKFDNETEAVQFMNDAGVENVISFTERRDEDFVEYEVHVVNYPKVKLDFYFKDNFKANKGFYAEVFKSGSITESGRVEVQPATKKIVTDNRGRIISDTYLKFFGLSSGKEK